MDMERCALGLVGWGTVGGGVVEILGRDAALFRDRCGLDLHLKTIVTRNPKRDRGQSPGSAVVTDRIDAVLGDQDIRTVIHLVGGTTEAKDICIACLSAGKHVVTANKALLAEHGDELFALAARQGVTIAFEAAVAGGIPIIAALRDGLVANRIEAIYAILNGTCNYILTRMTEDGKGYAEALREAQELGYAESDPTLDVNGTDTAHKLAILARIGFHGRIPLAGLRREGIEHLTAQDIESARTMGARIKLLAVAKSRPEGLELRVAPTLIPVDHPLASVNRNYNGVYVVGSAAGPTLLVGQGAGALPTASAVLADVVDVCTGRYQATASRFQFFTSARAVDMLPEAEEVTSSYARFSVADKPGVLAGITNELSKQGVSVLNIHQGTPDMKGRALIELSTHPLRSADFFAAIHAIDRSGLVLQPTFTLRRL
jgi:homoserine dehydrogenase